MVFRTLDDLEIAGKRVLVRVDLNVPVADGKVTDMTRIERQAPTIRELAEKGARVILLSHFDRPKGKVVPAMSLRPLVQPLSEVVGRNVAFAGDCVGEIAEKAMAALKMATCCCWRILAFMRGKSKTIWQWQNSLPRWETSSSMTPFLPRTARMRRQKPWRDCCPMRRAAPCKLSSAIWKRPLTILSDL